MDLRLIVITDATLSGPRSVEAVVRAALDAGAPAIQLRDKHADAASLFDQTRRLLPLVHRHGARLFVNDRLDVALAAGADGVHLGPDDIPLRHARRIAPRPFIIGCSTDDPGEATELERAGADYIGCGAVFGTTSKADLAGERIGPEGLRAVTEAVGIPVVGIGGVTPENAPDLAAVGAAGVAVIGAVMAAEDPGEAVRRLLSAFGAAGR